jgi:hypothetical protein
LIAQGALKPEKPKHRKKKRPLKVSGEIQAGDQVRLKDNGALGRSIESKANMLKS